MLRQQARFPLVSTPSGLLTRWQPAVGHFGISCLRRRGTDNATTISTVIPLKPRIYVTPGLTFTNSSCCSQGVFMRCTWNLEQTVVTSLCYINWLAFRRFRKIAKSDHYFRHICLSVRLSVRLTIRRRGKPRLLLGQIFMKFDISVFFRKSV